MFQALLITRPDRGYRCDLTRLDEAQLPTTGQGDVSVRVACSTLNYKDGLAITATRASGQRQPRARPTQAPSGMPST